MVEDPRIRSPAASCESSGSTTEKAARTGWAERQTRTVTKRPELAGGVRPRTLPEL